MWTQYVAFDTPVVDISAYGYIVTPSSLILVSVGIIARMLVTIGRLMSIEGESSTAQLAVSACDDVHHLFVLADARKMEGDSIITFISTCTQQHPPF